MCRAAGPPTPELLRRPSEVFEDLAVDDFELTGRRKDRDQSWNAVHDQARLALAFAQRILGALPLVDVRQQHAPANDVAAFIAQRKAVVLEPAIHAVRPPEPLHDFVWAARADRLREGLDDVRKVLGVNGVVGPPLFQLLEAPPCVFVDLAIDEFDVTARRQERDQAWNTVHQKARTALAFAQKQLRDFLGRVFACRVHSAQGSASPATCAAIVYRYACATSRAPSMRIAPS